MAFAKFSFVRHSTARGKWVAHHQIKTLLSGWCIGLIFARVSSFLRLSLSLSLLPANRRTILPAIIFHAHAAVGFSSEALLWSARNSDGQIVSRWRQRVVVICWLVVLLVMHCGGWWSSERRHFFWIFQHWIIRLTVLEDFRAGGRAHTITHNCFRLWKTLVAFPLGGLLGRCNRRRRRWHVFFQLKSLFSELFFKNGRPKWFDGWLRTNKHNLLWTPFLWGHQWIFNLNLCRSHRLVSTLVVADNFIDFPLIFSGWEYF